MYPQSSYLRSSLAFMSFFFAGSLAYAAEYTKLSPTKILEQVKAGKAVIIDVRENEEWDRAHLNLARSLPLSTLEGADAKARAKAIAILPTDKVIYLHCKAGVRCMKAAKILEKQGLNVEAIKASYSSLEDVFGMAKTTAPKP